MYWRVRMYECPRGQIIAKLTSNTLDDVKPHFIIGVKRSFRFIFRAKKVVIAGLWPQRITNNTDFRQGVWLGLSNNYPYYDPTQSAREVLMGVGDIQPLLC